ncbi:MAG: SDR family oxidoreductase [Candidatus Omnitrophica bacterium]|nr:SDR family oxidoreductase [Candidatus Omnitrophota bacterium]
MKTMEGKIVWVTGASRGIGRATALMFAKEGATLILNAREEGHLKEIDAQVKEVSGNAPVLLGYDVSDPVKVKDSFHLIHKKFKKLDVMVNNAGILEDSLLGMLSPELVTKIFSTNVFSVIYHMQYASRLMAKDGTGSIINVSSIIGRLGNEGQVAYGASKAAVIGATLSAAKELAPAGIRVNAIAPGFIDTDMVKQLSREKYDQRLASIKMKRLGSPEEVGKVIFFLASDAASYVTGQVIGIDGGMLV